MIEIWNTIMSQRIFEKLLKTCIAVLSLHIDWWLFYWLRTYRKRCFTRGLFQSVKHEQYEQFGYKFIRYLTPRQWYQFDDAAAVISFLESENQILLNLFSRWCSWAAMIIRVNKCHSFGIKKSATSSKQFIPKLFVKNELIPPVKQDEYFYVPGQTVTNNHHKDDFLSDTKNVMKI